MVETSERRVGLTSRLNRPFVPQRPMTTGASASASTSRRCHPPPPKRKRAPVPVDVQRYFEKDYANDGRDSDEVISDDGSAVDDAPDSSDLAFAGEEFEPTQGPSGYDQRAAYLAGLSTQAEGGVGPRFAGKGRRDMPWEQPKRGRRSSETSEDDWRTREDCYEDGDEYDDSFVVDDDVPLEYE
jgi:ATP-dependent DNA helicase MPH1